jgi:membrane protease YdiL (CAAX protease family)
VSPQPADHTGADATRPRPVGGPAASARSFEDPGWDLRDAAAIICLDAGIVGAAAYIGSLFPEEYLRLVAGIGRLCMLIPAVLLLTRRSWGVNHVELGIRPPAEGSLRFFVRFSALLVGAYAGLGLAYVGVLRSLAGAGWIDLSRGVSTASIASRAFLGGPMGMFSFAVLGMVSAPLCEELVFRGVFYPALRRRLGRGAAVLVSACVFAGIHLVWHMKLFPPVTQFLGGLIFAWSYEKTRSLLVPAIFHAVGNAAILAGNAILAFRPAWVAWLLGCG